MAKLEIFKSGASVKGILPGGLVTVVSIRMFGSKALELIYKDTDGKLANQILYRHDEPRLEVVQLGSP